MTIADWLRNRNYPEFVDGVLVFPPHPPKCHCGGDLIGDEVGWGSCGHCRRGHSSRGAGSTSASRPGDPSVMS